MQSFYQILEIKETATKEEIKIAYKKLARIHHPDRNGTKETFQKIQEAYETLSDDEKRVMYDNSRNNKGINFPFNIFHFSPQHGQIKKNDEYFLHKISMHDVYFGSVKTFNLRKRYMCEKCKITCDVCFGSGMTKGQPIQLGPLVNFFQQICHKCQGCGMVKQNIPCDSCSSSGYKFKEQIINLEIPRGVENGKEFRFKEWGEQAVKNNEKSGDFIIKIDVENNNIFSRDGLDLIYYVRINVFESIIGKRIDIPFFDEMIHVDTSQFGVINPKKEYMILEKGLFNSDGKRGNMKIKFDINYDTRELTNEDVHEIKTCLSKLKLI